MSEVMHLIVKFLQFLKGGTLEYLGSANGVADMPSLSPIIRLLTFVITYSTPSY